jgi:hypothetical protein
MWWDFDSPKPGDPHSLDAVLQTSYYTPFVQLEFGGNRLLEWLAFGRNPEYRMVTCLPRSSTAPSAKTRSSKSTFLGIAQAV